MSNFNYIVTCHNSERLIDKVLSGVQRSILGRPTDASGKSECIAVLDGCTDRTAEIIAELHPWVRTIETPDVHELLSINAGLRAADQSDGYNIILQDDVILGEPNLESLIHELYSTFYRLGYVSLRLGVDFGFDDGTAAYIPETHNLESVYGAGCTTEMLMPYQFAFRAMPIKSPVCLPCKVVREVGLFNQDLAPYAYDDAEYSLRCDYEKFAQGVFAVPFFSDYRWGGTRQGGHADILPVAARNCKYIRDLRQTQLNAIAAKHKADEQRRDARIQIHPCSDEQRDKALAQWKFSQSLLADVEHGVVKLGADASQRAFEMLHKNQGF